MSTAPRQLPSNLGPSAEAKTDIVAITTTPILGTVYRMPVPVNELPRARTLLRDDVYLRLRDAIVDGTFLPGEQLRDGELATWLGVSRTPVREAILRLQQGGLVIARPGRSTCVAPVDPRAIREAQAVVAAMHELAVREAVPALTRHDLKRMRDANKRFAAALRRGDIDAALSADDELHRIPVAASGNGAVERVLDQFMPAVRRLKRLRFASLDGRGSVDLHKKLIERCEAGDINGAARIAYETWQTLEPLVASISTVAEKDPSVPTQR